MDDTLLPIFARGIPSEPGDQFSFEDKGPYEVVRVLTETEAIDQVPAFVTMIKSNTPPTTRIYWVECKEAPGFKAIEKPRKPRWKLHNMPLHATVWTFHDKNQAAAFEKKIVAETSPFAEGLRVGCFYFLYANRDEWWFGALLTCGHISDETRKKIARTACDEGIPEITPPPDGIVREAVRRFVRLQATVPEGKIIEYDLPSQD